MELQTSGALRRSYLFQFGALLIICSLSCISHASSSDDTLDLINKRPMWMPNWMSNYLKYHDRSKRPVYAPNWMLQQLKSQNDKRPMWMPSWAMRYLKEKQGINKRPMWMPNWMSRYLKQQHRVHKKPLWTPNWQMAYIEAARRRHQRAKRPGSYNPLNWMTHYAIHGKRDLQSNTEDVENTDDNVASSS